LLRRHRPATERSSPALGNARPAAADILDSCFPSFRVRQPEVKTARLRPRDLSMLQLILLIAVALLLGWMLGRLSSRKIANKKGSPLVSAKQDAVTALPEKNRQTEQRSQPPGSRKPRSFERPRDSLVVYEGGKVIFRLREGEDADFANAKWERAFRIRRMLPCDQQPCDCSGGLNRNIPKRQGTTTRGSVILEALVGEDGGGT